MQDIDMVVLGDLPPYARWYATGTLRPVLLRSSEPVQHARVELLPGDGTAVRRTVVARAELEVSGRPVRATPNGRSARDVIDRLRARLRRVLQQAES